MRALNFKPQQQKLSGLLHAWLCVHTCRDVKQHLLTFCLVTFLNCSTRSEATKVAPSKDKNKSRRDSLFLLTFACSLSPSANSIFPLYLIIFPRLCLLSLTPGVVFLSILLLFLFHLPPTESLTPAMSWSVWCELRSNDYSFVLSSLDLPLAAAYIQPTPVCEHILASDIQKMSQSDTKWDKRECRCLFSNLLAHIICQLP